MGKKPRGTPRRSEAAQVRAGHTARAEARLPSIHQPRRRCGGGVGFQGDWTMSGGGGGAAWLRAAAAAGGGGEKLPCVTEWGLPKGRLVGAGCCSPLTGPQRSGRAARLRCQAPEAANSRAPRRGEGRGGGGTIRCTCHYKGSPMEGEGGGGIREGRKEGSERLQDWPILYKRRGPQHPFPAAVAAGEAERHTGRAARRAFG